MLLLIVIGFYWLWHFGNKGHWGRLNNAYDSNKVTKDLNPINDNLTIFFKRNGRWLAFNNLKIASAPEGLYLSSGFFLHLFMRDIFIPKEDIFLEDNEKIFFIDREVLGFKKTDVKVAVGSGTFRRITGI